jgi:hypothetical protein
VFAASESNVLNADLRRQVQRATLAIGEALMRTGYRGCFGLDFLLDRDTGALYLGEMNPRITGASPLTSQAALDVESVPLLLFHLLEWFGTDYELEVEPFNRYWLCAERLASWSQTILEHTGAATEIVTAAPRTGLWRMSANRNLEFVRQEFRPQAVEREDEALFLRTIDTGQPLATGTNIGRILTRGRSMTDDYCLTERARAWIQGFRAQFRSQSMPAAAHQDHG